MEVCRSIDGQVISAVVKTCSKTCTRRAIKLATSLKLVNPCILLQVTEWKIKIEKKIIMYWILNITLVKSGISISNILLKIYLNLFWS